MQINVGGRVVNGLIHQKPDPARFSKTRMRNRMKNTLMDKLKEKLKDKLGSLFSG